MYFINRVKKMVGPLDCQCILIEQEVPSSTPCYALGFFCSEELLHGMYGPDGQTIATN